jgi:hypothetical protein
MKSYPKKEETWMKEIENDLIRVMVWLEEFSNSDYCHYHIPAEPFIMPKKPED